MAISIKGTYDIKQYRNGEVIHECTQSNLIPNEAVELLDGKLLGEDILCCPYKNDYTPSVTDTYYDYTVTSISRPTIMADDKAGGISTYDFLNPGVPYDIFHLPVPKWIIDHPFTSPNTNNIVLSNSLHEIVFPFSNNIVINGFIMYAQHSYSTVPLHPEWIMLRPYEFLSNESYLLSIIKLNTPIQILYGDSISVVFSITGACT